jgi:hypothetical protein
MSRIGSSDSGAGEHEMCPYAVIIGDHSLALAPAEPKTF